ncbi:hypothetical protein [Micromonospora craterilacus]|uniref:hypothetical protein n=1 Tax=Micromonospora craterilacus TaxID=1655439 RepID=UPI0011B6442A|nr:hypothetical protein [Micromonospora craterilacus]
MAELAHRCEVVTDDDGQVIAVARVSPELTDEGRRALRNVIGAAIRLHESQPPPSREEQARVDAVWARHRERLRRLGGGR